MAIPSKIQGDQYFAGNVTFAGPVAVPAASFGDAEIKAAAGIAATKTIHQFPIHLAQANGTASTSETRNVHIATGAGTIVGIEVLVDTAAVGAATVTVDLHKGNAGSAYATLLTGVVTVNSSTAVRTPVAGTLIATPTYAASDSLRLIVTATAGGGTLPQGLCVVVFVRENPQ